MADIQIEEQGCYDLDEYAHMSEDAGESPGWDELKKPLIDLLLRYYNGED